MKVKPTRKDAYQLLHEGMIALAKVEQVGMRIDIDLMDKTIEETKEKISQNEDFLKGSTEWSIWKKCYGKKANLDSRSQLGNVLFDQLGYKATSVTKTGRPQVDIDALSKIDSEFVKKYLTIAKLKKLLSTYLIGIRREVCDGYLHPSFNLHMVRTYRSSASAPNFQNIPIRDKEVGKLIRSCFIPRKDHVLVEIDYGALVFRICACFHLDKTMIEYACNPELDIHRDMAAECYCLNKNQVTKQTRFHAKNCFVFPTLYNSYYVNTSRSLWAAIDESDLKTVDGMPLKKHLRGKGITRDNYEEHIKGVERKFNKRFTTWSKNKEIWWNKYQETGWFDLMTGFRIAGVFSRNQIANVPIQGPAFHCLLWSLIRMVKWLGKKKMRSCIIGQIHDSIVADVHKDELDDYLAKAKLVMTEDVREYWPWIVTTLEIEAETSETNWYEKKPIEIS